MISSFKDPMFHNIRLQTTYQINPKGSESESLKPYNTLTRQNPESNKPHIPHTLRA